MTQPADSSPPDAIVAEATALLAEAERPPPDRSPRVIGAAAAQADAALALLDALPARPELRRLRIRAWRARGNLWRELNTAESWREAMRSYDQALALSEAVDGAGAQELASAAERDDRANTWLNRGIACLRRGERKAWLEAERCFIRAIELRRALPLSQNPEYAMGLAAAWLNRGEAYQRFGGERLPEAVLCFDRALELLGSPFLANHPGRLTRTVIAWLNRGSALFAQQQAETTREAIRSFGVAAELAREPAEAGKGEFRLQLAAAWANRAQAEASLSGPVGWRAACASATEAVAVTAPDEQARRPAAEIGLFARWTHTRALARLLASAEPATRASLLAEASDVVDDAMALGRTWIERGEEHLRASLLDLFRFGARIYCLYQPQFLPEFVSENLDADRAPAALSGDPEFAAAADEILDQALAPFERIQFLTVDTPGLDRQLEIWRELRQARDKLHAAHPALRSAGPDGDADQSRARTRTSSADASATGDSATS